MKKTIIFLFAAFISISSFAQSKEKKDTTIQITVSIDQYRAILYAIDQNIDSKKAATEILQFISKNARMMEADKPKEPKPEKSPADKPKQ